MAEFRLKHDGGEFTPNEGVTTLGRTTDNDVSFPEDSNVSRFHAEIEGRDGEFCLIDLNSSNGTTVNGVAVSGEVFLKPGDVIVLGGSSTIVFDRVEPAACEEPSPEADQADVSADAAASAMPGIQAPQLPAIGSPPASPGSRSMLMIAGGAVIVALVVVGVAGAIYYRSSTSACDARAVIVKPEPGDTLFEATEIETEVQNSGCVAKLIFTIDGIEFAEANREPFSATLDPKQHPELADGFDHGLGIIIVDEDGNRVPQDVKVFLAMETKKAAPPVDVVDPRTEQHADPSSPGKSTSKEVSVIEIQEMTNRMVRQFSGNHRYNVSNKQFLQEVRAKTAEYAQEGFYELAVRYRDQINVAFVREQNLDAALAYSLAMSRSRFDPKRQGSDDGLWRMNADFVEANAYDGLCAGQPISEPTQNCAAKAAATYMKAMVFGVFDGDVVYSAAAFGKSTADATAWKATLPANRADVWNSIKTAPEREQLVRFFAAGIVADNPQKFGLVRDKAISTLYP